MARPQATIPQPIQGKALKIEGRKRGKTRMNDEPCFSVPDLPENPTRPRERGGRPLRRKKGPSFTEGLLPYVTTGAQTVHVELDARNRGILAHLQHFEQRIRYRDVLDMAAGRTAEMTVRLRVWVVIDPLVVDRENLHEVLLCEKLRGAINRRKGDGREVPFEFVVNLLGGRMVLATLQAL